MRPIPPRSSFAPTSSSSLASPQSSAWHSPVPYLFGGLAAMLGLIAFALMILACSFWKLSGHLQDQEEENNNNNNNNNNNSERKEGDSIDNKEHVNVYEDKILVIMAGHDTPTFLATPSLPKSSFSSGEGVVNHSDRDTLNGESFNKSEKEILDTHVVLQVTIPDPHTPTEETQQ